MDAFSPADHRYMREALALAHSGIGMVSPNPAVGAVLVKDDRVVGRGIHIYDLRKHAEVLAIEDAGPAAHGSTLYLNLESCSHTGRTGPCADAVIAAGISRVVCAIEDPNPAVSGRGFLRLRAAGISVELGLLADEARLLNESFAKWIRTGIPFVTLKTGMSLDAKIARGTDTPVRGPSSPSGTDTKSASGGTDIPVCASPSWITSEASRTHAQGLRHASDAILVGVGTVIADDPWLTDRTGLPRRRPLLHIVLDRQLRTPITSRLVTGAKDDLLIVTAAGSSAQLRSCGAEIISLPQHDFWNVLLATLAARQITSLLIEGGARIYASALNANIVDKLALYIAPTLLGSGALSAFSQSTPTRLQRFRAQRIEQDLLITGYLHDPYRSQGAAPCSPE
ncbi:MAG: bifunctional diaminohydroxyphosphoribosylaminopyrimidine deaminase/5-amino-6-(5-phosphoribosylamino)uracil reductase RibD [Acidobacteriaceae bacterium]